LWNFVQGTPRPGSTPGRLLRCCHGGDVARSAACAVVVLPLELSTEEAADALGLTPATVRTQIHRARADLHCGLGLPVDNSGHE